MPSYLAVGEELRIILVVLCLGEGMLTPLLLLCNGDVSHHKHCRLFLHFTLWEWTVNSSVKITTPTTSRVCARYAGVQCAWTWAYGCACVGGRLHVPALFIDPLHVFTDSPHLRERVESQPTCNVISSEWIHRIQSAHERGGGGHERASATGSALHRKWTEIHNTK